MIEDKNSELVSSYEIADNFMEAKFALRSCMQIVMEVLDTDNEEFNTWKNNHLKMRDVFNTELNNIKTSTNDPSWGSDIKNEKQTISKNIQSVDSLYKSEIIATFTELLDTKTKYFTTESKKEKEQLQQELGKLDIAFDAKANLIITQFQDLEIEVNKAIDISKSISQEISTSSTKEILIFFLLVIATIISFLEASFPCAKITLLKYLKYLAPVISNTLINSF